MEERLRSVGLFNDLMSTEVALQELDNSHFSPKRAGSLVRFGES